MHPAAKMLRSYFYALLFAVMTATLRADSNACTKPITLTGKNGSLQSPGYPSFYPNDLNCIFIIDAPRGFFIEVLFRRIKLVGNDFIQVSEGDPYPVKFYKGRPIVPTQYVSRISRVEVRFVTDGILTSGGFRAEYFVRSRSGPCFRRVFTDEKGTIESPRYPALYPPNAVCDYIIIARKDHFIDMKFTYFHMQDREGRFTDVLTIRDGRERSLQYFGTHKTPFQVTSDTNILKLRFVSDGTFEYGGFHAEYRVMHNSTRCSRQIMRGMKGSFHSPGYPENYHVDTDCEYIIEVDLAYHIVITFHDFELEPPPLLYELKENIHGDFLEGWQIVDEVVDIKHALVHYKNEHVLLQGKKYTPFKFAPRRYHVTLRFVADEKGTARGFNATYEAFENIYCGTNYDFLYVLNGQMKCDFENSTGFIQRCHITCDKNYVLEGERTVDCEKPGRSPLCVLDPEIFRLCVKNISDPKCPHDPGHVAEYYTNNRAMIREQRADKSKFAKNLAKDRNLVTFMPRETIDGLECGKHFCSVNSATGRYKIHCKSYAEKLMMRLRQTGHWADKENRRLQMHYCLKCQQINCATIPGRNGQNT